MAHPSSILYELFDFRSARGENMILRWVKDEKLTTRACATLNQKLDRLQQMDYELAKNTHLLAGPIYKNVYKLVIHADGVMLRPMLCRGPLDNEKEYTLLLGAIEKGGKLPAGAKEKAEENRETVIGDLSRRCTHERIPGHP